MTEYVYLHQDVFRNKIDYHNYICNKSLVVIFYTDKTKTDSSFSDTQFLIDGKNVHHCETIAIKMVEERLYLLRWLKRLIIIITKG